MRALEKQVNPAPWLLYGTDVIWLCIKASAFSSFVQLQGDVTPKHKKVPLCCGPSPAGSCCTSHSGVCPSPTQKGSFNHPAECKAPLWRWQSPLGACELQQAVVGARSFHLNCIQHALHFSNPQWGLCSPLQLPHNAIKPECCILMTQAGQLGQFNYFQGWNPFGGVYNATQFNLVTVHNCC